MHATNEELLEAVFAVRSAPKLYTRKTSIVEQLRRKHAEVILNYVYPNARGTGHGEASHMKYKRLNFRGGQIYELSADKLQFQSNYIN
jgi:hypothetical protein